ncbi:MAG: aminotransferase class III-fold pyridoxal phosphate-dependent enzyme [Candidatus Omnitrophica bacterium]|nr:aminotransferase class III-fold pyridoxal phosphate-dependent enzyme [Candidatus Omnitrophota bacterium]
MSNKLLRTFLNEPIPTYIDRGEGIYLYTKDGKKLLDTTGGFTSHAILGWSNKRIIEAMKRQLDKITHIDYKVYSDENRDKLAELLLSRAEHKLNRVYFAGNSGGEACEAAMKLSYQYHYDLGKKEKTWFISRYQSYHGSSTDALAVGDRPNLDFYKPLFPKNRAKISEHNQYRYKEENESLEDYSKRCAKELEDKILQIGPEKVCAFIGETVMGGLIGNVPPVPNHWKDIREVCDKYDVHLILDEVFCGTGTSGKIYCCDWDGVTPDFLFMGKTLAAGYTPISIVLTNDKIEKVFKEGQGRVQHSTTHQGHSLAVVAALETQRIIHTDEILNHVCKMGELLRNRINHELSSHPFFMNVRGRGLRDSVEYKCPNQNEFGIKLTQIMKDEHNILIDGKWHRVCFSPALNIKEEELNLVLDCFIKTFKKVAENWPVS